MTDLIVIAILLIGLVAGYKDGFIKGILDLLGLVVGIVAAISLTSGVVGFIDSFGISQGEYLPIIVAIVIFIVVVGVLSAFAEFLKSMLKVLLLGKVDQLLGLLFGGLKALVFLSILAWVFGQFGVFEDRINQSVILGHYLPWAEDAYRHLSERFGWIQSLNNIVDTIFPSE